VVEDVQADGQVGFSARGAMASDSSSKPLGLEAKSMREEKRTVITASLEFEVCIMQRKVEDA